MAPRDWGYYECITYPIAPGCRYFYRIDTGIERPDPASRFQPEGVHGPSSVTDASFSWDDQDWPGIPLQSYIIYEIHVGTFTPTGTFDAVIAYLDELTELGITALELMPVAQFPGDRNWGYDGVQPFAVQHSYGGPDGLKRLVNACHQHHMAVILDVVYNHLGPEGNYLADFGPYFTDRYRTPWGQAINFDGPECDHVRNFFMQNALYWVSEFHLDALRLDAVHAILDHSPITFLEKLSLAADDWAKSLKRPVYLISESSANDARLVRSRELGGFGLHAQWNDDFHHSLRTLLTKDRTGYYQDYGRVEHLAKAYREGFVYSGEYSPYHRRRRGSSARDIPADRFVVFAQNHDQVGNRIRGDRLSASVPFEGLKLAAATVVLSPFVPLLFMGEEYGETAPFPYFVSHADPELMKAVCNGRRQEFSRFEWNGEFPDPGAEETFLSARLNHNLHQGGNHKILWNFYRELLRLRKTLPALSRLSRADLDAVSYEQEKTLFVRRGTDRSHVCLVAHYGHVESRLSLPFPAGSWRKELDSATVRWRGPGSLLPGSLKSSGTVQLSLSPLSVSLFLQEERV
jgi:maltooligosyltrehalose trehalohydrolase